MVTIDSETVFNVGAAVTAVIAVAMFVLNVDLGTSPVANIAIVIAFLTGVFALTQRTAEHQATVLGYAVIIVSALILYFDVVSTVDAGDAWTVLGLLVIAGLLFTLRTRTDRDSHIVAADLATYAFAAVALVAVLILALDVLTGGLAYELDTQSEIELSAGASPEDEVRIGTVVVTNPSPLPRRVEAPRYGACAAGNWSQYQFTDEDGEKRPIHAHVSVEDGYNEFLLSYGTRRFPLELRLRGANLEGEIVPIETGQNCPTDDTGSPAIVVYSTDEDRPPIPATPD
jgi:hypothetical protein